jgi:tetratricopeptide (TPR) repeat protein
LVYAEAYLLKALLSIIHDESVMSFLRESLNIRSSYNSYMTLEKYMDYVKSEGKVEELDDHFTSGVGLGVGCFSLILSMLPASVVKVAEFIGFSSDRAHGLHVLEAVGGWDKCHTEQTKPDAVAVAKTGLRTQLCDMVLIVYHIILSKMVPLSDVDIPFAEKIINDCLGHYPRGVFFLYFNGRLMVSKRLLKEAEEQYQKAIDIQKDWKQLQHMCFWELGLIYTIKQEWQKAYDLYTILGKESNWSKAVYTYLKAINLYMLATETEDETTKADYIKQVVSFMEQVTGEKQKIAGKSIPMEVSITNILIDCKNIYLFFSQKFVARKARKFRSQNNYLLLPDLEMLNAFTAFDFMPVDILNGDMKRIDLELSRLSSEKKDKLPENHYDDVCLAQLLRAVTARMLYEQVSNTEETHKIHEQALRVVFEDADKVHLDHYIYYFGHFEKARMLMKDKDYKEAEANIQVVLKSNDRGHYGVGAGPHAKNKYSLASALVFKCHNCMSQIKSESK